MRRLRRTGVLRDLVRETELVGAISSTRCSCSRRRAADADRVDAGHRPALDRRRRGGGGRGAALGHPGRAAVRHPVDKDEQGSGAWDDEGVVQLATRAIKAAHPDLLVVADLCLCEYTSHGHCGVLRDDGTVDNDATLELLARTAVSQAEAGADVIAPSDMMDGRVGGCASRSTCTT